MRGEGKRHLILKKILAYALVLTMILGIWTSVSNAAEQSDFNVEENTIEEAVDVTPDANAIEEAADVTSDVKQTEEITTSTDTNLTEDITIPDTDTTEAEI